MDNSRSLGIARVALTVQLTVARERLEPLLREADKQLSEAIAVRVDAWVREQKLGYYPALEFLVDQGVVQADELESLRALAATIRKRAKRDVQTQLWPVFSSVHIERAQSLAFMLPRITPGRPDARSELIRHYFPNEVRLELLLSSLDKMHRLEDVAAHSEQKVMRNLLDQFESVAVSAARKIESES